MKRTVLFLVFLAFLGISVLAQEWTVVNTGYATNINGVTYLDEMHLFAVGGNGNIYASSDGGSSWSVSYTGSIGLNEVTTVNESTAIAVGWDGRILRYNGTSWNIINSSTTNALFGISFGTELVGYAVGEDGIILKSMDGGLSWTTLRTSPGEWLSGVNALDDVHVAAVSEYGTVFQTADGGTIWTTMIIPGNPWMGDVFLTGPGTGWCCGTDGTLYYFDGTSLTPYDLGILDGLMALTFISLFNDIQAGAMVGDFGSIFEFMNGDWSAVMSPTTQNLFCLAAFLYYFGKDQPQVSDSAMVLYCAGGENGTIVLNSQVVIGMNDPPPGERSSFIYPVPVTQGICFVKGEIPEGGIDITISDQTGKTVHTQNILYPLTPVNLNGIRNGLYVATIRKGDRVFSEKILVAGD